MIAPLHKAFKLTAGNSSRLDIDPIERPKEGRELINPLLGRTRALGKRNLRIIIAFVPHAQLLEEPGGLLGVPAWPKCALQWRASGRLAPRRIMRVLAVPAFQIARNVRYPLNRGVMCRESLAALSGYLSRPSKRYFQLQPRPECALLRRRCGPEKVTGLVLEFSRPRISPRP